MDTFVINGGNPLRGTLRINGSKNACLPLMAACLLTDEPVTLVDVPNLSDIRNMMRLLAALGVDLELVEHGEQNTVTLTVTDTAEHTAHYDIVKTMRAGICVLGPMLAKRGEARVSMPGGCAIGDRPVDLHLRGLEALGAEIELDAGDIITKAPITAGSQTRRLVGNTIFLGGPNGSTVLGTANVMCAAALAEGETVIECAACEPEIADLANMLNKMGAKIEGAGSPRLTIQGVEKLHGVTHQVIPDRIEAGTYAIAGAMLDSDITLTNYPTDFLMALHDRLDRTGVSMNIDSTNNDGSSEYDTVRIQRPEQLTPTQIVTQPHPGFPTDLQAQMMAMLCLANGNSLITEKIYQDRFLHVAELARMGAQLKRSGPSVMVAGIPEFIGAPVMASDLRASAGLVLAGLAAKGTTTINRVYHLDRGYEKMELALQKLGADIQRIDDRG